MANTFSGIESLITSLRVQSLAQQIVTNNIANAATRGFSRQLPILMANSPQALPSASSIFAPGQVGSGVSLQSIARVRDEFLDMQIRREHASAGQQQAIYDAVAAMSVLFPELNATPGSGFVTAVKTLFADFTAVAATPGSAALRKTLVTDAVNMTGLLNEASRTLGGIQGAIDADVRDGVARVAGLLDRIASANDRIGQALAAGGSDNASMDARDQALADLSDIIKVDVVKASGGQVTVLTGNGRVLVRGSTAAQVVASINPHEPRFAGVGLKDARSGVVTDITGELRGGRIAGQVAARDGLVADQLLELDELANGLITQVNLLHQAGYAQDGITTGTAFFTVTPGLSGSEARDITVNAALVANNTLVAASRLNGNGADGEQAKTIGLLSTLLMNATVQSTGRINNLVGTIDPTVALNNAAHTPRNGANPFATNLADWLVAPTAGGTIVINGVSIPWAVTDSLETIIGYINNPALGLGVRASFDFTRQRLALASTGPLTVFDSVGNLTAALRLETRVVSLAPVNNGIGPLDRPLVVLNPLSAGALEFRTPPDLSGGTVRFDWQAPNGTAQSVSVNWTAGQTLAGALAAINAALGGAGAPFSVGFSAATQSLTIQGNNALPASTLTPISPVTVTDVSGNLGFAFNLEAQPAFGSFTDALTAQMQAQLDDAGSRKDQANAAVSQLQAQQDAVAKVNLDEEKFRLLEYARAYEATVKAMAVMDEVLNTLINRMAASSFSSSTSSVLSS